MLIFNIEKLDEYESTLILIIFQENIIFIIIFLKWEINVVAKAEDQKMPQTWQKENILKNQNTKMKYKK